MCVCVCMYVCMYVLIITGVQASGVIIMYECMYVCMCVCVYVCMYVCINKDLKKLLACEQISHPRTPESPRRACWQAKKLPPHHSCVVHGDCLPSRNVAIIKTLLYTMLAEVILISLHWRGVSLEETVNKSQRPAWIIIAISDGHIFVSDCQNRDHVMIEFKSK